MLPAPEVEHLYIHVGRAYELNAEWEKARTAYTSMLAYAREAGELAMESTILNRLAILAAQQSFDLATAERLLEGAWRVAEASGDPVILAETREALASLQEVAILAHEIGLPGELWQIEVALGEVYASSGERAGASDVCQSDCDCARKWRMRRGARTSSPNLQYGAC